MALKFLNDGYFAGKVGIGTESPDRKLHVKDSNIVVSEFEGTNTGSLLDLVNSNASQLYNGIRFTQGTSSKMAVTHIADGTTKGYVQIGNSWATGSEILVVDGRTSNVGIGTTSPTEPLTVSKTASGSTTQIASLVNPVGTANTGVRLWMSGTNTTTRGTFIDAVAESTSNDHSLRFGTSASSSTPAERMRITSGGNVGIGTTNPASKLHVVSTTNDNATDNTVKISHSRSDTDVGTNALYIDMNLSGADATTADRQNRGIFVDIDSTADGDATNEHRIRGVNSDVRFSGFSDIVQSGYFYAESNNNTVKTAQLIGVYGNSVHDSSTTSGGVSNMYGVYGLADIQDLGDVDNAFGGFFQVNIGGSRGNANIGITKGVEGQINIDKATTIDYGTMMAVSAIIDNNEGAVPNFGNQFLFRGDYQGDRGSDAYGVYCEGDKHYLEGKLAINLATPTQALHVAGNARVTGAYYDSNNSPGTANQVLVSTVTGTDWIDGSAIPGVPAGSGTLNTVAMWTPDGDTLGDGPITFSGNNSTFSGAITIGTHLILQQDGTNDLIKSTGNVLYHKANEYSFQDNSSNSWVTIKSGKVGIGTTSPSEKLQVNNGKLYITESANASTANLIYLENSGSGGNEGVSIKFNPMFGAESMIASNREGAASDDANLTFHTALADVTTERMRIDSSGNVGIGTTLPLAKLDVDGVARARGGTYVADIDTKTDVAIVIAENDYIYTADGSSYLRKLIGKSNDIIKIGETGTSLTDGIDLMPGTTGGYVQVFNNSSVVAKFVDGKLGIGTTAPSQKLNVVNDNTSTWTAKFTNNTNNVYLSVNDANNYGIYVLGETKNYFSGNIGIGTTSPSRKLHVNAGTDNEAVIIESSDTEVAIELKDTTGTATIRSRGDFRFDGSSGEIMRMESGGNVGIGTTSPRGKLQINGNSNSWNDAPSVRLWDTTNSKGWLVGNVNNYTAGDFYIRTFATVNADPTSASQEFTIKHATGNVGIGITNPTAKLHVVGTGLFTGLVSGITPVAAANFVTKAYVDGSGGGTGPFLPLAGGTMTGTNGVVLPDNFILNVGTGNDLRIYHDGTNDYIVSNGTYNIFEANNHIFRNLASNEDYAKFIGNGAVELYYNGTKKFETTSTGVTVTGDIQIDSALLSNQENTDIDSAAAEMVAQVAIATYTAAFFDFVVKKSTNVRSGTVYACHDGTNVEFTETSTQDLGDTSDVTLSVDISGGNMRLLATVTSDDWSVKSLIRAI